MNSILKIAASILVFSSSLAFGEQLKTDYYPEFGTMTIEQQEESGLYQVDWDRNNCMLNDFGIVNACSKMASFRFKAELLEDLSELEGETMYKRYQFSGANFLEMYRMVVVVKPGGKTEFKILELDSESHVMRAFTLNKVQ